MAWVIGDEEIRNLDRAFDELAAAMRRSRARAAADSAGRLTPSQFELLRTLYVSDSPVGMRVSVLARAAGIATPTTTRMLNGLEGAGLCDRRSSPTDGRGVSIALTQAGREAVESFQAFRYVKLRRFFSTFDAAERAAILRATSHLTRLADEFTQLDDPADRPRGATGRRGSGPRRPGRD